MASAVGGGTLRDMKRFDPTPNLSPPSSADRLFAGIAGIGLLAVAAAALLALGAIWIFLMLTVAAAVGTGLGGFLEVCLLIAMGGIGLAFAAGLVWSVLQAGSVRRTLGLR